VDQPVLEMQHITKRFFDVTVLDDVTLDVHAGEVHALVGENGAGKSTLMKILGGEYRPDGGTVVLDGAPVRFHHPRQALAHGIGVVHQEFTLLPERTVAENVLLGREPRGRFGVDRRAMESTTAALLAELKLTGVSPRTLVRQLSVAQQHGVEIAKALSYRPRILVLDEPTAALTQDEVGALFDRVRSLVAGGPAVLYISHRLTEIFDLAHRVTVLKDGRLVRTLDVAATTAPELVQLMVGRSWSAGTARSRTGRPRRASRDRSCSAPAGCTRPACTASTSSCAPVRSWAWPGWTAPGVPASSRRWPARARCGPGRSG